MKTALSCFVMSLIVSSTAFASDWVRLDNAEIDKALVGKTVVYTGGQTQDFSADGSTNYIDGRPTLGYWRSQGNQYCSQWPPSGSWDCYVVERQGEAGSEEELIRFTSTARSAEKWVASYK